MCSFYSRRTLTEFIGEKKGSNSICIGIAYIDLSLLLLSFLLYLIWFICLNHVIPSKQILAELSIGIGYCFVFAGLGLARFPLLPFYHICAENYFYGELFLIDVFHFDFLVFLIQAFKETQTGVKPPGVWKTLLEVIKPVKSTNLLQNCECISDLICLYFIEFYLSYPLRYLDLQLISKMMW